MEGFISAIPAAATNGYAFGAYALCATLFIFGGAKLRELRSILRVIKDVPEHQRAELIRVTTGRILPKHITAEQWIRHNRNQGFFSLGAGMLVVAGAVAILAFVDRGPGPPPPSPDAMQEANAILALMDAGKYEDAWNSFYAANKQSMPLERWLTLSRTYRAPLGRVESRVDAGSTPGVVPANRPLNGMSILFHTKFENLPEPIAEQVGVGSPGVPIPWKVISYTVAVPPGSPVLTSSTPVKPASCVGSDCDTRR